jgi:hypothetical protein
MQHANDLAFHFSDDDPMTRCRRHALEAGAELRLIRSVDLFVDRSAFLRAVVMAASKGL